MKTKSWILALATILCLAGCKTQKKEQDPLSADSDKIVTITSIPTDNKEEQFPKTEELSQEKDPSLETQKQKSKENELRDQPLTPIGKEMGGRAQVQRTVVFSEDFEQGDGGFTARGPEQAAVIQKDAYAGAACFAVTGRTATWHGAKLDVSAWFQPLQKFELEAWVKFEHGQDTEKIYAKVEQNGTNYLEFASVLAKNGEWVLLKGSFEVPVGTVSAAVYFETEYNAAGSSGTLADLYIDDVVLTQVTVEEQTLELPGLSKIHQDYFTIGVAVTARELTDEKRTKLILHNFNSMTMGNEMKPENILDYAACSKNPEQYKTEPALKFNTLDLGMKFAQDNQIPMRGHTLIWHSQTPRWFFTEDYSKEETASLVSKEIMLARMESYIRQVLTYCQKQYPGVIYCWDVVNEAIEPADGEEHQIRTKDNYWYQTIGPDYVEYAFTFARTYADPSVRLFYNDYNCYEKIKLFAIYDLAENLYQQGLLDGIGLQSHIGMSYPSMTDYQYALTKLGELGCEIQITELDISLDSNDSEAFVKLGTKYKKLMTMYRYLKDQGSANITNVTVWGLSDELSWLNKDGRKYPLLFDDYLMPKEAYYGFCLEEWIPAY